MTPIQRLATAVRDAMLPLQDASSNSPVALKQRQAAVYAKLWSALEAFDRAMERREKR